MISNWEEIDDAISAISGDVPRVKGDNHIHTCPFCGKRGHFTINYQKGKYNCYRCGGENPDSRGDIRNLAEILGVEIIQDGDTIAPRMDELEQKLSELDLAPVTVDLPSRNEAPVDPPEGFVLLSRANARYFAGAVTYLYYRGLTWEEIQYYRVGVAMGGARIVLTDWNAKGQLRWWQLRVPSEQCFGPKYVGPEADKAGKLGHWHQAIQRTWYVGVAEGAFSAMAAGPEFVWLWGKEYSQEQVETLSSCGKTIVVCLDGEAKAVGNTYQLVQDLQGRGCRVTPVALPNDEDPASMGRVMFRRLLSDTLSRPDSTGIDYLRRAVADYV